MGLKVYVTKQVCLLLISVTVTQASSGALAPSFDSRFSKVDPGDDVTGNVAAVYTSESLEECVLRCSGAGKCKALQYNGTRPGNCVLIRDNSTLNGRVSISNTGSIIFLKVYSSGSIPDPVGWSEPDGWTGPEPILYWSFDTLDGLMLMEQTNQAVYDALTDGKVNKALTLDVRNKQWVDLGVQTQACLIVPETCGSTSGAAVAFWVYLRNCAYDGGIMSSTWAWPTKVTGFRIYCVSWNNVRFYITLEDSFFYLNIPKVKDVWVHLVMNNIGPRNGQGFQVFQDGTLAGGTQSRGHFDATPGNGSLVLGKRYVNEDDNYAWIDVDELVFFNRKLTAPEVMNIYNNENSSDYQFR